MVEGDISADAVTADLRTQSNKLSFWRCDEGTDQEIENVVLAMAAGRDRIDKIEIVLLDETGLINDGQTIRPSDGRTPIGSLVKLHVDVIHLNYSRLGEVARRVALAVAAGQCRRVSKKRVEALLVTAVAGGDVLQINGLNDKLRQKVQELLKQD